MNTIILNFGQLRVPEIKCIDNTSAILGAFEYGKIAKNTILKLQNTNIAKTN